MRRQQRFEALAQGGVAGADSFQKSGALLRWLFQGERKQGFFAVRIHWEIILRLVNSLRVLLGEGDTFVLECRFRFALPGSGGIRLPPHPAPVKARFAP